MKKFLSLVLALVMTFSLVTIASAKDYTDQASIKNTEAVAVVSGMGIIGGYNDGSYKPANTLTRQAATKFIANMKLGPVIANMLPAGESFKDVPADSQFAGFIAYCADNGIVNGVTADTFNPGGTLTGYAFVKMLLNAAGIEGNYVGDGWQARVLQAALKAGIVDTKFVGSEAIIRDDAALYTFRALQYAPNGTTSEYVVKDNAGKVLYKGADAVTALLMFQSKNDNELALVETADGSLGDTVFGLTKGTVQDPFGRKSVVYTNGKDAKDKAYVEYAKFDAKPVLTYTTNVPVTKVFADLGYTKGEITINWIEDGYDDGSYTVDKNSTWDANMQGNLLEVYATGTADEYDLVYIETYLEVLGEGDVVAANKETGEAAYIWVDGEKYETEAFKEGDVVLYNETYDGTDYTIANVVKAPSFTGTVTAFYEGDSCYEGSYIKVDGKKYEIGYNHLVHVDAFDFGKEYTFYTDNNGYIMYAVEGKVAEPEYSYTYLLDTASKAATTAEGGDLFTTTAGNAAYAQAKVIDLATGAIKVVNLGVVKTANGYFYADKTGAATSNKVDGNKPVTETGLFTYYTLTDGSVVLGTKETGKTVTLAKGKANIGVTGNYATSATVLKVVELTKKDGAVVSAKVSTSTGIANFADATYTNAVVTAATSGAVSSILVVKEAEAPTTVANYAVFKGTGETDSTGTKIAFYVGGKEVQYYKDCADTLSTGAVYDITVVDGKVTAVTPVTFTAENAAVADVDATFFMVGTTAHYFADNCVVVDSTKDYAVGSVTKGAKVSFVEDAGKVVFVEIVK